MNRAGLLAALVITLAAWPGAADAQTAGATLRVSPSVDGRIGAWLVAGPFVSAQRGGSLLDFVPAGIDESKLVPRAGATLGDEAKPWIATSSEGSGLDVRTALGIANKDKDLVAYASAVLEVPKAGRYLVMLGTGDGVRLFVDGKAVFSREEPRAAHDDDDIVPLDLRAGSHTIVLKLRRYEGGLIARLRMLDADWRAPPKAAFVLPGASSDDVEKIVRRLSWVSVDRGLTETGYEPRITVRYPEGFPVSMPVRVNARIVAKEGDVLATAPAATLPVTGANAGEIEIAFAPIEGDALTRFEDRTLTVEVDVAGRIVKAPFYPRRATRLAVRRAFTALSALPQTPPPPWLKRGSFDTVDHLRRRLVQLVSRGDGDLEAQAREAKELDAAAAQLEATRDPLETRTGFVRRAYTSPVDGELAHYGLYVPESYKPGTRRSYPLVVALHGLNGKPLAMLRWFFGGDDPKRDQDWEDRHHDDLAPLDAFVLAPNGHGNTMYRHLGQDDVMRALDEVMALYPIDASRVTITGPSMGGIGAAALAFRHPDRFAASAPLCGYHSVFVRRDVQGRSLKPWEKFLAEERSNVSWAWNGRELPLYIVHGTQDTPVENSGALIERYEALKYSVLHEHPVLGHNVWQPTYEDLKGAKWLLGHTRDQHPRTIRYRTARTRDGRVAWADITELTTSDGWGELDARVRSRTAITATTKGIAALTFDRDEKLVDPAAAIDVTVDGQTLSFTAGTRIEMYREGEAWKAGLRPDAGSARKRGTIAGPFRDVFHEPLVFIYGTSDESEARANEEVARSMARIRWGVDVRYPVMSDREFLARGEPLANSRGLVLVGAPHSNEITRQLDADLPIHVTRDAIVAGSKRFTGKKELGAAFVFPNPKRRDRYVAVVAGTNALGTFRALSLPDLLPDFVVWDEHLAPAKNQMVMGAAAPLAAGYFGVDWSLPANVR